MRPGKRRAIAQEIGLGSIPAASTTRESRLRRGPFFFGRRRSLRLLSGSSAAITGRRSDAVRVLASPGRPAQCEVNLRSGLKCRDGIGACSQLAHSRNFQLQRQFQRFAECGVGGLASHFAHNAVEVLRAAESKLPAFTWPHARGPVVFAPTAPRPPMPIDTCCSTRSFVAHERGHSVWTEQKRCQIAYATAPTEC